MNYRKRLESYLLRAFDLSEDQLHKTFLLQLNIFLLITTLLIIKPTVNALFLSELTAHALPTAYILTAIAAVVGSFFYTKGLERYSLKAVISRTLIGSILVLVLFGTVLNMHLSLGYLLYIPYIWIAIYGLLTTSQFWILANLVYNAREAKRVFGFIGAGAIAGGIFGGYLTSILANFISSENLFFVAAFLLFWCIPITRAVWSNKVQKQLKVGSKQFKKDVSPFQLIKQSKLLSYIAILIGLGVIVAKLVDYQFSRFASKLITNPEELTSFFGVVFSTLSLVSLLIQLFFTKRIVGTFGVGKSLLWLPLGILIGSILLLFVPELWVVVMLKVIEGSFKQSINKASTELLVIPISLEVKKKTKTFIDVVVDSIATGIAGLILIFFINGLAIKSVYISLIIIVLILVWIVIVFRIRKAYLSSFRRLLAMSHRNDKSTHEVKEELPVTSIIESIKRVFKEGSESQILHMLHRTIDVNDERFFYEIKSLLGHKSDHVKALALENLYHLDSEDLSQEIEKMVYSPSQLVAKDAYRYLLSRRHKNPFHLFENFLDSEVETIKNATLVGLSLELQSNTKLQQKFRIEKRLQKSINEWHELKNEHEKEAKIKAILQAIGNLNLVEYYPIISDQINHVNHHIAEEALKSAAKTKSKIFIYGIISNLSRKELREAAIETLHDYGTPIILTLVEKTLEEKIDIDDAHYIPRVIETFGSQKAIQALLKLIDTTEHSVTIEAIEALKRLKWKYPELKIREQYVIDKILDECQEYQSILSSLHTQIVVRFKSGERIDKEDEARKGLMTILEHRLDRQLHRIFKFLGIKYPPDEIEPIVDIIIRGEQEQRVNAIEFLDNALDNHLKRELIPIAESVFINDNYSEEIIHKLNLKVYDEYECYSHLLDLHDIKIKHAVLYLIKMTDNKNFIPLVQKVINDHSKTVSAQAKDTLNYLSQLD